MKFPIVLFAAALLSGCKTLPPHVDIAAPPGINVTAGVVYHNGDQDQFNYLITNTHSLEFGSIDIICENYDKKGRLAGTDERNIPDIGAGKSGEYAETVYTVIPGYLIKCVITGKDVIPEPDTTPVTDSSEDADSGDQ